MCIVYSSFYFKSIKYFASYFLIQRNVLNVQVVKEIIFIFVFSNFLNFFSHSSIFILQKIKKQILKRFYTYKIVVFSMKKKNHVTYWPHLAPLRILVWNAIRETVVCNLYCVIQTPMSQRFGPWHATATFPGPPRTHNKLRPDCDRGKALQRTDD